MTGHEKIGYFDKTKDFDVNQEEQSNYPWMMNREQNKAMPVQDCKLNPKHIAITQLSAFSPFVISTGHPLRLETGTLKIYSCISKSKTHCYE